MVSIISLKVPDIEAAVAELAEKGIKCKGKPGGNDSIKGILVPPKDTCGIWFELIEYEDRTPTSLANINRLKDIPSPI